MFPGCPYASDYVRETVLCGSTRKWRNMEEEKKDLNDDDVVIEEPKLKVIRSSLDNLPFGTVTEEDLKSRVKKAELPDGVNDKMIYGDVIRIAWPSFLEMVLAQLTSMADQIMVGSLRGMLGVQALSAVGLAGQPKFLLMTMMMSLNVGATALIARARGQQDRAKANQIFKHALYINIVLATLFMVVGVIWVTPIMRLCIGYGISDVTFEYAKQYFLIQMYGFVPLCCTFTITATLRGIGDSRMPLIYNTTANVVNVIFNYLLIYGKFGFPMLGVAGASLATVIGQCTATTIAFIVILRKNRFISLRYHQKFKFNGDIIRNIVSIGFPALVEQLFMRAGQIIFTRIVASLGDIAYATHSICMNIQAMSFMTGQSVGNASTTLIGQCLGKKRLDMAEIYARYSQRIGLILSTCVGLLFIFAGKDIIWLYNKNEEVIRTGAQVLIMVGLIQPFQSIQFVRSGALRGAGDTKFTMVLTFFTVMFCRTLVAYLCVRVWDIGLFGAWIAIVVDQIVRALVINDRYKSGKWRAMRLRGEL